MYSVPALAMVAAPEDPMRSFAMCKNLTRVLVALLVLVTLTAGAAQAAPWSFGDREPSPSLAEAFWDLIVSWLDGSTVDEGCGMDPDGRCHGVTVPEEEQGCGMDPNGSCGD
jgi:hypothetical protein